MKMLKINLCLIACILVALPALAQTKITLAEAVSEALQNNASVQAAAEQQRAQQALRKTSFDLGKTNISWMRGQYNSLNQDNNITISQSIPFPTVAVAEARANKARAAGAVALQASAELELAHRVKQSYLQLQYLHAQQRVLQSQDSVFRQFARAARLRYEAGETTLLEKTTAEAQAAEATNALQQNERDLAIENTQLQTLLHTDRVIVPSDSLAVYKSAGWAEETLAGHPQLTYWKHTQGASAAARRVEQSRLLPDITIGYFNQSLIGFQRSGNSEVFFDKTQRFDGWIFGLSLPLWFRPQLGRAEAASHEYQAAVKQQAAVQQLLTGSFAQGMQQYEKSLANLRYFEQVANANAALILTQAQLAYQRGEVGYVEYLQAVRSGHAIRSNYLQAIYQHNLSILYLDFLSGKK